MDRALIERMVGAVVLLVLLVFIAPAMLDGSREVDDPPRSILGNPETRVETIVLDVAPGSEMSSNEARNSFAAAPPDTTPPVESEVIESQVTKPIEALPESAPETLEPSKPEALAAQPAEPPTPAKPKVTNPPQSAGNYIVQLGIFSSQANAEKFAARIKARGFSVKIMSVAGNTSTMYRVYAGPRQTREDADQLVKVMANSGYKGLVTTIDTTS